MWAHRLLQYPASCAPHLYSYLEKISRVRVPMDEANLEQLGEEGGLANLQGREEEEEEGGQAGAG